MNCLPEMFEGVSPEWRALIAKSRGKLAAAIAAVNAEMAGTKAVLRPAPRDVFAAFRECPRDRLRVVLIGQDPYPNATACGLSFSSTIGIPPSVKSIIGVCPGSDDLYSADLTPWAARGVLLLNLALTTVDGRSDAHTAHWREFTHDLIANLVADTHSQPLIFILLGAKAQSIEPIITAGNTTPGNIVQRNNAIILKWGHPSPLSRYNQTDCRENFKYCDCFSRVCTLIPGWSWRLNTWIFADGACSGNGKKTAKGSWAIYVAAINGVDTDDSASNTHAAMIPADAKHTNNCAELRAILGALLYAKGIGARNLVIVSDSEHAIGAATTNAVRSNADIINPIRKLVVETRARFKHIYSHTEAPTTPRELFFWRGNDIADKAATNLVKKYTG